ncbi:hypothetical protein MEQU1_001498 [Malassezia equina]|uniref:Uncharacterized protein n=1 Tax=Malassezia equina TaxID=1381935 RepID=A0AAF0IYF2_9BASI|nr:hypothetical protein MEQU1_001498 [Malassezia equina]
MQCKPLSDQYSGFNPGQLRSVDDPTQCVTSGFTATQDKNAPVQYVPDKHAPITLQPCASEDNDILQRQWMSYFGDDRCPPFIDYHGHKSNPYFGRVVENQDHSLTFSLNNGRGQKDYLRLSDTDVPYKCSA